MCSFRFSDTSHYACLSLLGQDHLHTGAYSRCVFQQSHGNLPYIFPSPTLSEIDSGEL